MICNKCQTLNLQNSKFCKSCGTRLNAIKIEFKDSSTPLNFVFGFFFTMVAYLLFSSYIFLENESYTSIMIMDLSFVIITLIFFAISSKENYRYTKLHDIDLPLVGLIIITMPVLALIVDAVCTWINIDSFNIEEITYYSYFINSPRPILYCLLSTAVVPALFEELAFRGFLFNHLLKIMDSKQTILVSAILFTLIHFSAFSILWIFPLGLLFGVWRINKKSIWYGVFGHFIYNSSIIMLEVYDYNMIAY